MYCLTPFLFLVLLHILSRTSIICLAGLLAWLPTFGWARWKNTIKSGKFFLFEPKLFCNSVHPSSTKIIYGASFIFPIDALRAANYIQKNYNEPFTLYNSTSTMMNNSPISTWNAIESPSNYAYMPIQARQKFIRLTAATLQYSG
jgi:hypothetical protein